jgi:hypothetical protein
MNVIHILFSKAPEFSRSNTPARKWPVPGTSGDFVEAEFQPEIFRIFSNDFWPFSAGKHRKLAGIHRKNPKNFRPEYCFHAPVSSGAFMQDPVARILDLGC